LKICDLRSDLEHFPSNVATWSNRFHFEEGVLNCLPQANFLKILDLRSDLEHFPSNGQTHLILKKVYRLAARRRRIILKICDLQSDLEHFPSNVATWSNRFHFEEGVLNCLPQANFLKICDVRSDLEHFPSNVATWSNPFN